jgi:Transposase DDE domain group 1
VQPDQLPGHDDGVAVGDPEAAAAHMPPQGTRPSAWPGIWARSCWPSEVAQWSLTTLREKLVKIGARLVRHSRYVVFQLAEVAVPRALFAGILRRIDGLRLRPPPAPGMRIGCDERPRPSMRSASMIDGEALLRSNDRGRKPQNPAVGSLAARPACCIRRIAHDWRAATGKWESRLSAKSSWRVSGRSRARTTERGAASCGGTKAEESRC